MTCTFCHHTGDDVHPDVHSPAHCDDVMACCGRYLDALKEED